MFILSLLFPISVFSQTYIQGNSLNTNSIKPLSTIINMNSAQLSTLIDPTHAQDAATKNYVDTTTQPPGNYITALTGDVTATGPGSVASSVAKIQGTVVSGTTGSGNVVFSSSPSLVTPALGTPSALVGTNITGTASGLTAGNINATTNSTITTLSSLSLPYSQVTGGPGGTVTAISIASSNGFAGSSSGGATPALTISTSITGILQGNGTSVSAATTTGSGSVVLATSPTLTTPALGTPSALVGTNITGTGASFTAGHVTTNANLTGDVTSVGNATTLAATTNATLTTISSLVSVGTITTGVWSGTTIAIANGGTGQTSASAAFNALSPMTTGGDLIYGGASGAATRLANGSAGQVLTSNGTTAAPSWAGGSPNWVSFTPTDAVNGSYTAGSANCLYFQETHRMQITCYFAVNSPAASVMTMQLPNSATVAAGVTTQQICGLGISNNTGGNIYSALMLGGNAYLTFSYQTGGIGLANQAASGMFLGGQIFSFQCTIPI